MAGAIDDNTVLAAGITLLAVGIVCGISACFFDCITKSKEEQFRKNVKKELTPELLKIEKQTAEARIRAAREARTIHYVAQE
ncbi:MAG: hypothetical protein KR126chlam3_01702 [Chlamydiae bacterium]|nr:hypothetical protein [Chlamydiota bacterium]